VCSSDLAVVLVGVPAETDEQFRETGVSFRKIDFLSFLQTDRHNKILLNKLIINYRRHGPAAVKWMKM
jgi:hypothetical protein